MREFLSLAGVPDLDEGHSALERICDALAVALDAKRLIGPGAGHFVAAAPSFGVRFEQFLSRSLD